MVRHVVLFGIKAGDGLLAIEQAKRLGDLLLGLKEKIDFVQNLEVGVNSDDADPTNSQLCLIVDVNTIEEVKAYAVHEEHVKVAKEIGKYKTSRACVDYVIK